MKKILYADIDRCVGCHACEVACRQEHNVPLEETRIKIVETEPEKVKGKLTMNFIPLVTDKCTIHRESTPACVSVCPTQAMGDSDINQLGKIVEKGKICILKIT